MKTAGAAHREGGRVTMESQGREGLSEHAWPSLPCKVWEIQPQGGAGPQDPSVQCGGPRFSTPPPGTVSFVLERLVMGEEDDQLGQTGEMMERVGCHWGHSRGWEPARGERPACLHSVRLSVCVWGRVSRVPSVGSHAPPYLSSPAPPRCPPVRMSDGRAPPRALGPRPGSRSLAADTVCFPARDAHPRHRPFLLAPPTPMGLPGGPGCWAGPAFSSRSDGQTEPSPTLSCTP